VNQPKPGRRRANPASDHDLLESTPDGVVVVSTDDFATILPGGAGRKGAERIVRKMLRGLREGIAIDGRSFEVSVSAGLGLYPEDGANVDRLIRRADLALYAAKREGRGFLTARLSMLSP
jgi:GGDEF domain-containing protein